MRPEHSTSGRFFVYTLSESASGRVFYVGKSRDVRLVCLSRFAQHIGEMERGCRCRRCNKLRKLRDAGVAMEQVIVYRTHVEADALDREVELIALIGRRHLTNGTDGGELGAGRTWSEKRRAAPSREVSEETRQKIREKRQGHTVSPETRAMISAKLKGRPRPPRTDEYRAKISAALTGKHPSEETRQKQSAAKKGKAGMKRTPEHCAAIQRGVLASYARRKAAASGLMP